MEKFSLNNQIEKVLRGENTCFLNPIDTRYIINILNKMSYPHNVFYLFSDTEKLLVYKDNVDITLFEIKCSDSLTHREILGSLFSHNLKEEVFSDIIIDNNKYFVAVLNKIKDYMICNFNKIGSKKIELIERDISEVENYHYKYKSINIQVSSLRIDGIISKLIPTSRKISQDYIDNQKVIMNYQVLKNKNYSIKENDIFSIRGIGKFKVLEFNLNKNNKYQVIINKYI